MVLVSGPYQFQTSSPVVNKLYSFFLHGWFQCQPVQQGLKLPVTTGLFGLYSVQSIA